MHGERWAAIRVKHERDRAIEHGDLRRAEDLERERLMRLRRFFARDVDPEKES